MTNKLLLGLIAATAVAAPASAQRLPAAVVAVVDTNRISAECTACRAAAAQLQGLETQYQTRQQQLSAPITTEGQAIQAAVQALPEAQRRNPPAAIQQRIQRWEQSQNTANQELQRLQQNYRSTVANVQRQIEARLVPIIAQVATQRGATVAVERGATLFSAPAVDITNEVLTQLNTQLPSVSVTPLPQQQQPTQGR